jgi:hypothetical protein
MKRHMSRQVSRTTWVGPWLKKNVTLNEGGTDELVAGKEKTDVKRHSPKHLNLTKS